MPILPREARARVARAEGRVLQFGIRGCLISEWTITIFGMPISTPTTVLTASLSP